MAFQFKFNVLYLSEKAVTLLAKVKSQLVEAAELLALDANLSAGAAMPPSWVATPYLGCYTRIRSCNSNYKIGSVF